MNNKNDKNSTPLHMPIFMCIGISLGMAVGVAMKNIPVCMCVGLGFGLCVGSVLDMKNRKNTEDITQDSTDDNNEEIK